MWSCLIESKRTCLIAAGLISILLLLSPICFGATREPFTAEAVKSAYLLNFGRFVEWETMPQKVPNRFYICIIGENPLGKIFEATIRDQKVKDRTLEIVKLTPHSTTAGCQIAYLNLGSEKETSAVLLRMKSTPTLTVGDEPHFLRAGGMIQLDVEGEHVRIKVNLGAVRNSSLTISSKLLALAEVIE